MRSLRLWLLAASSLCVVSACSPTFDAEEQNSKNAITAGRDDVTLRLAAAAESGNDLQGAERMYLQQAKSGAPKAVMELAGFYTRHNQAARGVEILDEASKKSPKDMNLMRALANALISAGNPEKALAMLDDAIANKHETAYIYNSRGVALDRLGRYDEAQKSYQKAVAMNPADEMDFKTNLSMSYILDGHYSDAIKLLSPLVTSGKATSSVRQNLALAYGLKGDMDMAMKIGSKDLTIKEMNENIRFYSLMTKGKNKSSGSTTAPQVDADLFPVIAEPPAPIAEDAPEIIPAVEAPEEVILPETPIVPATPAPRITPVTSPIADSPDLPPPPPPRNLSPLPPAPKVEAAPKVDVTPEDKTVKAKVIKPVAKPKAVEAPAPKKAPPVEKEEPEEVQESQSETIDTPAATSDIPVPVLKPDKW